MNHPEPTSNQRVTRLARELVGGKPVSQVPLNDILAVTHALQEARDRATSSRRLERVHRIDKILCDLSQSEYSRRPKTPRKSAPESPEPVAVLDSILDDLVSGIPHDVVETQMIPQLTERAKFVIDDLLSKGKYQKAQRFEDVHRDLIDLLSFDRESLRSAVIKLSDISHSHPIQKKTPPRYLPHSRSKCHPESLIIKVNLLNFSRN
jgi:hypothetical protein